MSIESGQRATHAP